jgi:hypothetical protein
MYVHTAIKCYKSEFNVAVEIIKFIDETIY